eukprot:scaffold26686_cov122-Isochrysis_galbana.AAC.1
MWPPRESRGGLTHRAPGAEMRRSLLGLRPVMPEGDGNDSSVAGFSTARRTRARVALSRWPERPNIASGRPHSSTYAARREEELTRIPEVVVGEVALQQAEALALHVVHQQPADGVLARGHQHALARVDGLLLDGVDPIRDGSLHAVLEGLGVRQFSVDADPAALDRADERLLERNANVTDVVDVCMRERGGGVVGVFELGGGKGM